MNDVQVWWSRLALRERAALLVAGAAVSLFLLWWLALAPALRTLSEAPEQKAKLQGQWQTMQAQSAMAQSLQRQPRLSRDDTARALEESLRQRLGASAQLSMQGERAVITLKGASAQGLAQWLANVRALARVVPSEAHLVRASAAPSKTTDLWDGTLVLTLPTKATPP